MIKSSQHNSFNNKKRIKIGWNKITKHVDGPSIPYKDEHFAENYIKFGLKFKKLIFVYLFCQK